VNKTVFIGNAVFWLMIVLQAWAVLFQMSRRFFAMDVPVKSQLPVWLLFLVSSCITLVSVILELGHDLSR
jgi:hypothetical protein